MLRRLKKIQPARPIPTRIANIANHPIPIETINKSPHPSDVVGEPNFCSRYTNANGITMTPTRKDVRHIRALRSLSSLSLMIALISVRSSSLKVMARSSSSPLTGARLATPLELSAIFGDDLITFVGLTVSRPGGNLEPISEFSYRESVWATGCCRRGVGSKVCRPSDSCRHQLSAIAHAFVRLAIWQKPLASIASWPATASASSGAGDVADDTSRTRPVTLLLQKYKAHGRCNNNQDCRATNCQTRRERVEPVKKWTDSKSRNTRKR